MKKWLFGAASVVVTVLLSVSGAMAKGLFVLPGARANGFGGAFYAIADDATAIYWNPAGLAQLKGYGAEVSGWYEANNTKSNHSLGNAMTPNQANGDFPLPNIYGSPLEPNEYSNKEMETSAFFPFLAGYGNVDDMTVAAGFYVLGGGGGKWKDSVAAGFGLDTINASLEATQQVFMVYNVSAAKQLTSKLSVGLGVDCITFDDKLELHKDYVRGAGSFAPVDYGFYDKDSSYGSGLQLNAGLKYDFLKNLQAGLVFRSGASLKINGTTYFGASGPLNVALQSSYDRNFNYPMTYGAGIAYEPSGKWTLALGAAETDYSTMKHDITYASPVAGVFTNDNTSQNWKDVTQVMFGAEYRATDKLSLTGGIRNDPTPYSRDNLTLTDVNQYDFTYYTIGAGYDFGTIKATLLYVYGQSEKLENQGRTFEFPMNMAYFDVAYKFK